MTINLEIIEKIEAPRSTSSLIGHQDAIEHLERAINKNKLPHGCILYGPKAIGKSTLAWHFIKSIHSRDMLKSGTLENERRNNKITRQIVAGSHPDCRLIRRNKNTKPPYRIRKDISVDDIRLMTRFFNLTPTLSKWRTVVIDSTDDMNQNAQNALLKILEEPPANTLIILICHSIHSLLPTVSSRCLTLKLRPLSIKQVNQILQEQDLNIPNVDLQLLSFLSDGSPGNAINLLETNGLDLYKTLVEIVCNLPSMNESLLHKTADSLSGASEELSYRTFIDLILWWLSRIIRYSAGKSGDEEVEIAPGEMKIIDHISGNDLDRLLNAWNRINILIKRSDSVNLDRKQVILNIFFELSKAAR